MEGGQGAVGKHVISQGFHPEHSGNKAVVGVTGGYGRIDDHALAALLQINDARYIQITGHLCFLKRSTPLRGEGHIETNGVFVTFDRHHPADDIIAVNPLDRLVDAKI